MHVIAAARRDAENLALSHVAVKEAGVEGLRPVMLLIPTVFPLLGSHFRRLRHLRRTLLLAPPLLQLLQGRARSLGCFLLALGDVRGD